MKDLLGTFLALVLIGGMKYTMWPIKKLEKQSC